ncbi:MAG: hypothetical protein U0234_02690 [Sandaracinus sp.]
MRAGLCVVAFLLAAVAGDAHADETARACPSRPPVDGTSCPQRASCRYPRRGVVCACQADAPGRGAPRHWVCGELGE